MKEKAVIIMYINQQIPNPKPSIVHSMRCLEKQGKATQLTQNIVRKHTEIANICAHTANCSGY